MSPSKTMRTQEEVEKKYEELNKRMADLVPNAKDVQNLREKLSGNKELSDETFIKIMTLPTDTISTDAQRYILEWVMGQHGE